MAHTCKALVLHCMDFRLQTALRERSVAEGLSGDYDLVSLAGAMKDLVHGSDAEQAVVLKQIEISSRLHGIQEIVFIAHTDCGAYGGRSAFADEAAERAAYETDLRAARDRVVGLHPNLKVRLVLAKLSGEEGRWSVDFETIE